MKYFTILVQLILILIFTQSIVYGNNNNHTTADHEYFPVIVNGGDDDYNRVLTVNPVKGDRDKALKLHKKASGFYKIGKIHKAEISWLKSFYSDPSWGRTYYNLACMRSLMFDKKMALALVEKALKVSKGSLINRIIDDSDLDPIKTE